MRSLRPCLFCLTIGVAVINILPVASKTSRTSIKTYREGTTTSEFSRRLRKNLRTAKCDKSFVDATTPEFRVLTELFHEPLLDRTNTLTLKGVKTKVLVPLPDYEVSAKNIRLGDIARARATEIWRRAGEIPSRTLEILFSGGIDSTSVLTALLETRPPEASGRPTLIVKMAPRAVEEYPHFFFQYISAGKLPVEYVGDFDDICEFVNHTRLTVTGELGDQLFGSNTMARAASSQQMNLDDEWTQEAFWKEPLQKAAEGKVTVADLQAYLAPQLAKSPIPIKSLFDFLWWINFSFKWQHVSLRLLHCHRFIDKGSVSNLIHFFETPEWQQWSYHNHAAKMPDKEDWKSYKEPLKRYIRDFTGDMEYYINKVKVGSLEYKMTSYRAAMNEVYEWTEIDDARYTGKALIWAACSSGMKYEAYDYYEWRRYRMLGDNEASNPESDGNDDDDDDDGGSSAGAIIVTGIAVGAALLLGLIAWQLKKRRFLESAKVTSAAAPEASASVSADAPPEAEEGQVEQPATDMEKSALTGEEFDAEAPAVKEEGGTAPVVPLSSGDVAGQEEGTGSVEFVAL